ncbi:acyl carrier protein [Brachybacterium squillarum]|uniref:acyl carrier protein n=1 Tax=Brachybacterium squillarum TaxID=661979 RepID=UPI00026299B1|nr:acyl carrier protein [Brachybacterium squillarum]
MDSDSYLDVLADFAETPRERITMEAELADIGLDSLSLLEIIMRLETATGASLDVDQGVTTVQELFDHVRERAGEAS